MKPKQPNSSCLRQIINSRKSPELYTPTQPLYIVVKCLISTLIASCCVIVKQAFTEIWLHSRTTQCKFGSFFECCLCEFTKAAFFYWNFLRLRRHFARKISMTQYFYSENKMVKLLWHALHIMNETTIMVLFIFSRVCMKKVDLREWRKVASAKIITSGIFLLLASSCPMRRQIDHALVHVSVA